jgi:hypothetical protein
MFQTVGPILAIAGMASSAIGAYYSAKTQQYQLNSQALTMDFQKSMSELNAKNAEFTAQTILESGQRQIGAATMRAGNVKGAARASMAAPRRANGRISRWHAIGTAQWWRGGSGGPRHRDRVPSTVQSVAVVVGRATGNEGRRGTFARARSRYPY